MIATERGRQIEKFKNTKSAFVDYARFEGDAGHRKVEKDTFIRGKKYTPEYNYTKLDTLIDDDSLRDKKTAIYEAVLELEVAKQEPDTNEAELEIYRAYHELRLKKIMLVEAARNVNSVATSGEWEVAVRSFAELNKEVYGEFDGDAFEGMMTTEMQHMKEFEPVSDSAQAIKNDLTELLGGYEPTKVEESLMSDEMLRELSSVIKERYAPVLAAVPETEDDVYYDASQCAEIMNNALLAGGLAEHGWKVVIDPLKSNPATSAEKRIISLPASTRRNSSELRRLIIHEQEVHARRGENGRKTGFKPLESGTADYADVEEGLGVLLECIVAGNWDNPSFHRARDRYITTGLALGIDGTPRDARTTYETLWRMIAIRGAKDGDISEEVIADARERAYAHVENAFRGTQFWMRGTIYTKLKVYFEGLKKNVIYLMDNKDDISGALDRGMLGKYDHTSTGEYENIKTVLNSV